MSRVPAPCGCSRRFHTGRKSSLGITAIGYFVKGYDSRRFECTDAQFPRRDSSLIGRRGVISRPRIPHFSCPESLNVATARGLLCACVFYLGARPHGAHRGRYLPIMRANLRGQISRVAHILSWGSASLTLLSESRQLQGRFEVATFPDTAFGLARGYAMPASDSALLRLKGSKDSTATNAAPLFGPRPFHVSSRSTPASRWAPKGVANAGLSIDRSLSLSLYVGRL